MESWNHECEYSILVFGKVLIDGRQLGLGRLLEKKTAPEPESPSPEGANLGKETCVQNVQIENTWATQALECQERVYVCVLMAFGRSPISFANGANSVLR